MLTAYGVCWSKNHNPTIAENKTTDFAGTDRFVSNMTELTVNTTYFVKAYATNGAGTSYGSEVSFTTLSSGGETQFATDIDGDIYNTIQLGSQLWKAENLKTSKFSNGEPIPNITSSSDWAAFYTGAYCCYKND